MENKIDRYVNIAKIALSMRGTLNMSNIALKCDKHEIPSNDKDIYNVCDILSQNQYLIDIRYGWNVNKKMSYNTDDLVEILKPLLNDEESLTF